MTRQELVYYFHRQVMDENDPNNMPSWAELPEEDKKEYDNDEMSYKMWLDEMKEFPPMGPFFRRHEDDPFRDNPFDHTEPFEWSPGYVVNQVKENLESKDVPYEVIWFTGEYWMFTVMIPEGATTPDECESVGSSAE